MRRLAQFVCDLALIPAIWRRAVEFERHVRHERQPDVIAAREDAFIASLPEHLREEARQTAPSGRWARGTA